MDKDAYRKVVTGVFFERDLLEVIILITFIILWIKEYMGG